MSERTHGLDRRELLRLATAGMVCAGASNMVGGRAFARSAAASSGYRALVIVRIDGGADTFNLLVPSSGSLYSDYLDARQDMAIDQTELLPIVPSTSDGNDYGLHPSATALRDLFDANRLAVLRNVGNLVQPVTKAAYDSNAVPLPPQLFSHNDQSAQAMRIAADATENVGWGGALADVLASMNGSTPLGPCVSLAGNATVLRGRTTQPYGLGTNGTVDLFAEGGSKGVAVRDAFDALRQLPQNNLHQQQFASIRDQAIEIEALLSSALDAAPPLVTVFPEDEQLADQLQMIARLIQVRGSLGMQRQVFYARLGGWDTHADQQADLPVLISELSQALGAFQAALDELGVANDVTTLVQSEFGRTLTSNGKGTDHGWGGHALVLGGSVRGGDLYGTYPSLVLDGADDAGKGRVIPTTANDQVAATLARWMGLAQADLPALLPNLPNFATDDLGFMA